MRAALHRARDRLLTNPAFRRFATAFPLTRPIARRQARKLFDLAAGFVYSQVLMSCVELDLFEKLAEGPRRIDELASEAKLSSERLGLVLRAAASLDLLEDRKSEGFGLGPLGAALVGDPGLAAMFRHHRLLYADLADPLALLRDQVETPQLSRYWAYAKSQDPTSLSASEVAEYSALMAASQPMIAEEVLAAFPFAGAKHLLDVGGGEGAFLAAVAKRLPNAQLTLFDLPGVAERARCALNQRGLGQRVEAVGGSFLTDDLPGGADVISLVRILHDHDDAVVRLLLGKVKQALAPGGRLLIAEPMADAPGAKTVGAAYFGLYLLAMGQGRVRTLAELSTLLHEAGFGDITPMKTRTPLLTQVLVAKG